MPGKASDGVTPKGLNKVERAAVRANANAAMQRAMIEYFDQIDQAVFQAYLQQACPGLDPASIPPRVRAKAKKLAAVARGSAFEHFPQLLVALLRAGVLAYQHTKGAKTGNTRKSVAGGRKPDSSPWKVEARRYALFTQRLGLDVVVERLAAGRCISIDEEVVSVLDGDGSVTGQYDLPEFKKKLSSLMGRARAKKFSGE